MTNKTLNYFRLQDNLKIFLILENHYFSTYNRGQIENYMYSIWHADKHIQLGFCDLRIGDPDDLYWLGNIGYNIFLHQRGYGYASLATKLLLELARKLGLSKVIITCDPNNIASKKTIIKCGGEYIDTVNVPAYDPLFLQEEYVKERYLFNLRSIE